jgi:hypothetical protein
MKPHYLNPNYLEGIVVGDASLFNIVMFTQILGPYITSPKLDFNNGHNG